jgi:hypothetical protein
MQLVQAPRWRESIAYLLEVPAQDLVNLHKLTDVPDAPVSREYDQRTPWHERYYAKWLGSSLRNRYKRYAASLAHELFHGQRVVAQIIPTFRVQYPGNVAVGEAHSDAKYGHAAPELNVWLPFTEYNEAATICVQHPGVDPDDEVALMPVRVEYGQALVFDGVKDFHGNQLNDSDRTRVSFDFRLAPLAAIEARGVDAALTVNTGVPIGMGTYFEEVG